jgi:hypothetical protein
MITLRYEFDLLRVSHLPYDTIRYDIQKTHYAYPYNIYPNWYFWFENKPSGNPVIDCYRSKYTAKLPSHYPYIGQKFVKA